MGLLVYTRFDPSVGPGRHSRFRAPSSRPWLCTVESSPCTHTRDAIYTRIMEFTICYMVVVKMCLINPLPAPGIVVGAVHGRRGTRAAARRPRSAQCGTFTGNYGLFSTIRMHSGNNQKWYQSGIYGIYHSPGERTVAVFTIDIHTHTGSFRVACVHAPVCTVYRHSCIPREGRE